MKGVIHFLGTEILFCSSSLDIVASLIRLAVGGISLCGLHWVELILEELLLSLH